MSHANARITPAGRLLIVQRIEAGMPLAHVARQMGLSRGVRDHAKSRSVITRIRVG